MGHMFLLPLPIPDVIHLLQEAGGAPVAPALPSLIDLWNFFKQAGLPGVAIFMIWATFVKNPPFFVPYWIHKEARDYIKRLEAQLKKQNSQNERAVDTTKEAVSVAKQHRGAVRGKAEAHEDDTEDS